MTEQELWDRIARARTRKIKELREEADTMAHETLDQWTHLNAVLIGHDKYLHGEVWANRTDQQDGAWFVTQGPMEWRCWLADFLPNISDVDYDPDPGVPAPDSTPALTVKSCNMHTDCDAADVKRFGKLGSYPNYHCHDDRCVECF